MLPSFRLIAVTFVCGFIVMFAGLRLATSLNDIHQALPVSAAQAAPVAVPEAAGDSRRGSANAQSTYDWRFALRSASQTPPINVTALVIDRSAPLLPGLPLQAEEAGAAAVERAEPADNVVSLAIEPAPAETTPEAQKDVPAVRKDSDRVTATVQSSAAVTATDPLNEPSQ